MLKHGAYVKRHRDVARPDRTHVAAAEGHTGVIPTLLDHDAELHARSLGGYSALLFAAREGHIDVVEALLDAGAPVDESLPLGRGDGTPPGRARRRRQPASMSF